MYLYYGLAALHIQRKQLVRVKLFVTIIQVKYKRLLFQKLTIFKN